MNASASTILLAAAKESAAASSAVVSVNTPCRRLIQQQSLSFKSFPFSEIAVVDSKPIFQCPGMIELI